MYGTQTRPSNSQTTKKRELTPRPELRAQLLHLGPGLANALANLHNARRANSPVLNIVGDMATWHRGADAALETDIESLARSVSAHVCTSLLPGALRADGVEALRATRRDARNAPGAKGRVSTLIVPHDRSWEPVGSPDLSQNTGAPGGVAFFDDAEDDDSARDARGTPQLRDSRNGLSRETEQFLDLCADALVATPRGKVALYCGGDALLAADGAIQAAGAVAGLLGGELLCENAFARVDRGADLPSPRRLPYFPKDAARELARFQTVVCVDAKRPVAMFGYADAGPSHLLRCDENSVWDLDVGGDDVFGSSQTVAAIVVGLRDAVARRLGREIPASAKHDHDAYWTVPPRPSPKLPFSVVLFDDARREDVPSTKTKQKLTPDAMCAVVAALQPEDCVVVDESLTSGTSYWDRSAGCPRFQHLTLTGGAIGLGPCASVGAAVAAGGSRRVVNLQADGCCAYAPQALWTQARERLNVVTIVCANRRYAILELEKMVQRTRPVIAPSAVGNPKPASKRLTSLADPDIDWTKIAQGFGVPATRADCPESFARALKGALEREGPSLIEAVLE